MVETPNDFNYKGGSLLMQYKRKLWNYDLPSDPEIVASVFCHLLDNAYFDDKGRKDLLKNPTYHLLDST